MNLEVAVKRIGEIGNDISALQNRIASLENEACRIVSSFDGKAGQEDIRQVALSDIGIEP